MRCVISTKLLFQLVCIVLCPFLQGIGLICIPIHMSVYFLVCSCLVSLPSQTYRNFACTTAARELMYSLFVTG